MLLKDVMEGGRGSDLHFKSLPLVAGHSRGRGRRDWSGQMDKEAFALIQAKDQRTHKRERRSRLERYLAGRTGRCLKPVGPMGEGGLSGQGDAWLFGPNELAVGRTMYPIATIRQGQVTEAGGGDETVESGRLASQEPVGCPSGPFWQTVG